METRKVAEIIYREDLYPRIKADPVKIQEYAENIEVLPPIEINQNNELIDGFHRWTAHRKVERNEIAVFVTETKSEAGFLELAIIRNATHGYQMSMNDKKDMARKLYIGDRERYNKEMLQKLLSVSSRSIYDWLTDIDKADREKRKQKIRDMWLACYTEDEIAEVIKVTQKTVHSEIQEIYAGSQKSIKVNFFEEDWTPPIYNVWTFAKKSNEVSHFGNSEPTIVDNLLYLYTNPLDIVVDPFAGSGSTIGICKNRMRRYWISDRKPIVEMESEIRKMDICEELPPLHNRWSDVTLTYLDPPYWKQAEGKYSSDPEDLANKSLDDFTKQTADVIRRIAEKQSKGVIAMLMQPTQWNAPERRYTDHVFDIVAKVGNKRVTVENRVSCPYSTQQANEQMVDWAKDNHKLLVISRELIIWKVG